MDLSLMSLSNSPLASVLLSDVNIKPLVYSTYASMPALSRNKISIPCSSSWGFSKTNVFSIPRYGLLYGLALKLCFSGDAYNPGVNCGSALVASAVITSHSREILRLESLPMLYSILKRENNTSLMDLAGNFWSDTSTSADMYIILPFSFFDSLNSCLDTSYIEPLELSITLRSAAECFETSPTAVDTSRTEVIAYYLNMSEADRKLLINTNMSPEKPLSLLCVSNYAESPVIQTSAGSTLTVPVTCPNLMKRSILSLVKQNSAGTAASGYIMNHQKIDSVTLYMSGREVYKYSSDREAYYESAAFYHTPSFTAGGSSTFTVNSDVYGYNIFVHNYEIDDKPNQFTGAVSGKGVSNMYFVVTFTPANSADRLTLNCVHEYINIVSISSQSGKISNSISL